MLVVSIFFYITTIGLNIFDIAWNITILDSMGLHEFNTYLIERADAGIYGYIVMFFVYIFFMILAFFLWTRVVREIAMKHQLLLKIFIAAIVIDTIIIMGIFFYEMFFGSFISGFIALILSFIVVINGAGWASFSYLFRLKSDTNRVFPIKLYMPMMFMLFIGYFSHIYVYSLFYKISENIVIFWEYHSLGSLIMVFWITTWVFFKSIFSWTQTLSDATIELTDEFDIFLKKLRKSKK